MTVRLRRLPNGTTVLSHCCKTTRAPDELRQRGPLGHSLPDPAGDAEEPLVVAAPEQEGHLAPPAPGRPLSQGLRKCPLPSSALMLRTTRDSSEPATGCARRFRFEPREQESGSRFDRVCPAGREPRHCSATKAAMP
jgi:hypothetical protein